MHLFLKAYSLQQFALTWAGHSVVLLRGPVWICFPSPKFSWKWHWVWPEMGMHHYKAQMGYNYPRWKLQIPCTFLTAYFSHLFFLVSIFFSQYPSSLCLAWFFKKKNYTDLTERMRLSLIISNLSNLKCVPDSISEVKLPSPGKNFSSAGSKEL